MTARFPTRQNTDRTAELGVNVVSTIINDHFGWVFRRTHQEHDFGVDAFIDYVTDGGNVTGKFLAAQIKTGKSYLSSTGNMHWYKDSKEHLNYFLNLPTPILLIICDPDSRECFWSYLDKSKVDYRDKNWRHPVPKSQKLCNKHKKTIEALFGDVEDHLSGYEQDIDLLKMVNDSSVIMYSVPKVDIEKRNTRNLKSFIEKITRNERLTIAVRGKLYISTYGYENDDREVHQIKEVRRWAKKARKKIKAWYLCAGIEKRFSTLFWIAACTCSIEVALIDLPSGKKKYQMKGETKDIVQFMAECYKGLNEATDKWGWSEKFNNKISKEIGNELFPGIPYPEN